MIFRTDRKKIKQKMRKGWSKGSARYLQRYHRHLHHGDPFHSAHIQKTISVNQKNYKRIHVTFVFPLYFLSRTTKPLRKKEKCIVFCFLSLPYALLPQYHLVSVSHSSIVAVFHRPNEQMNK